MKKICTILLTFIVIWLVSTHNVFSQTQGKLLLPDSGFIDTKRSFEYDEPSISKIIDTLKVQITGNCYKYKNRSLTINKIDDYITDNTSSLQQVEIEKDGDFNFEIIINELTKLQLNVGKKQYELWIFPDENYNIKLLKGVVIFNGEEKLKGADLTAMELFYHDSKEDLYSNKVDEIGGFTKFKKQMVYMNNSNSKIADEFAKYSSVLLDLTKMYESDDYYDQSKFKRYQNEYFAKGAMQYLNPQYVKSFICFLNIKWKRTEGGWTKGVEESLNGNYKLNNENTYDWEQAVAIFKVFEHENAPASLQKLANQKLDDLLKIHSNGKLSDILKVIEIKSNY